VIVDVDGRPINRENRATLLRHEGSALRVRVKRNGDELTFDLKLEEAPAEGVATDEPPRPIRPIDVPNYPPPPGPSPLPELIDSAEPRNT
jgi:hypothetical protein